MIETRKRIVQREKLIKPARRFNGELLQPVKEIVSVEIEEYVIIDKQTGEEHIFGSPEDAGRFKQ